MKKVKAKIGILVLVIATVVIAMAQPVVAPPPAMSVWGMVRYDNGTVVPDGWNVSIENLDEVGTGEPWNTTTMYVDEAHNYYRSAQASTGKAMQVYVHSPDMVFTGAATKEYTGTSPLEINVTASQQVFDMKGGTYPSIAGNHTGTIKPFHDISIRRMYTYPCAGTGGHSKYVAFYYPDGTKIKDASWSGYRGNYHYIKFAESFTLEKDVTYNYTVITGSYPQIVHNQSLTATDGTITCTRFADANGNTYNNWIPAIRLE